MKLKLTILVFAFIYFIPLSFSQFRCGFDELHHKKLQTDPSYRKRIDETEKDIQSYIQKNKKRLSARVLGTAAPLYTIPVVVHVVHTGGVVGSIYNPSDAQIQGAIDYLNQVFNGTYPGIQGAGDLQIQFTLAQRDQNCDPTTAINRIDASSLSGYSANGMNYSNTTGASELSVKNLSRWDAFDYYNIWIVNKIDGNDGTSGSFLAGFAYFPLNDPRVDGTVMLATQMVAGAKTLPHEIGHAFALLHPFEGSSGTTCPTNTSCSTQGDLVCDTDPITQPVAFACRTGINSCTGTVYNNYTEYNFMNYTNCYNLFTPDQKTRMLAVAASIYRKSLSTSPALTSSNISFPYAGPVTPSCTPSTSGVGLANHYAGLMDISLNGRAIESSTTRYDAGYIDGTKCIKVVQLNKGNTYPFSMTVLDANRHQLRAWIDYNNDGNFDNTTEQIYYSADMGNGVYAINNTFTVPTSAVSNTVVRMRVIDDLVVGYPSTTAISNACHNPYYGQAEDYPIYLSAPVVLPSSAIEFAGQLIKDEVQLRWRIKEQVQLKDFDIEKSNDGIIFNSIGRVEAQKEMASVYTYTDVQADQINHYRLRLNDLNGSHVYSSILRINYQVEKQNVAIANNPFQKEIFILFNKKTNRARLQLFNLAGNVVAETEVFNPPQNLRWQIEREISKGVYIVKMIVDDAVFYQKVIKE